MSVNPGWKLLRYLTLFSEFHLRAGFRSPHNLVRLIRNFRIQFSLARLIRDSTVSVSKTSCLCLFVGFALQHFKAE